MTRLTHYALLGVLVGWLVGAAPASAAVAPKVDDQGKFFSAEAVEKANQKIREIYREFNKDLLIETVPKIPSDLEAKYKEQGKSKFFVDWADKRAKDASVNGIYVLLCREPPHLQVEVGTKTRQRAFTLQDRDRLVGKMVPLLKK